MHTAEKIFISYRRADTEGYAGRLEDSLSTYFGRGRVFRDVGDIKPGEDFVQKIKDGVASAKVVIVLIGPNWLASQGNDPPRLHDPNDYVAAEITAALQGPGVVVPVLVQNGRMPHEEELPAALEQLARRNATSVSDENWADDVARLARVIAMDVSESATERRLRLVQHGVLWLFGATLLYGVLKLPFGASDYDFLVAMLSLVMGGLTLALTAKWFHQSRRIWVWLAVAAALVGGIITNVLNMPDLRAEVDNADKILAYTCATIVATLILAGMSGFKARDWLK